MNDKIKTISSLRVTLYSFLASILWAIHFMVIYALAEFGCQAGMGWTSRAIIGVTLVILIIALYSIYKSWRLSKQFDRTHSPTFYFLTHYGILNNIVFTFIIAYQSVPVFYFRGECL